MDTTRHSAALTVGKKMVLQGPRQYVVTDENGNAAESYSISAGIDYPGCGPEHCYLKDTGIGRPATRAYIIEHYYKKVREQE